VGEVTLGGRRVAVDRPRVRSADGRSEVRLRTCEYFGGWSRRRGRRRARDHDRGRQDPARALGREHGERERGDGAARSPKFRKIVGYRDLATLLIAIERDHHRRHTAHIPTREAAIVVVA
jgi:hypothetical protein